MEDKDILLALGRLEGKMDSLISAQKIFHSDLSSHDQRIRALEGSRSILWGACALGAAFFSYLVTMLSEVLGGPS